MSAPIRCQKTEISKITHSAPAIDPAPPKAQSSGDQFLDVDLQKAARSGLYHPQFMAKMIAFDFDGDGHLRTGDLNRIFGKSVVEYELGQKKLSESIQRRDYDEFLNRLIGMGQSRNSRMAGTANFSDLQTQKFGISGDKPFDLRDAEGMPSKKPVREELAKFVGQGLAAAYQEEFGEPATMRNLVRTIEGLLSRNPYVHLRDLVGDVIHANMYKNSLTISAGMSAFFIDFTRNRSHLHDAEASAWLVYSDYIQPDYAAQLEKQFGFNIRIQNLEVTTAPQLSCQQTQFLQTALSFIQSRRPDDLKLLLTLDLYDSPERGGAYADSGNNHIELIGPFANASPKRSPTDPSPTPGHYARESLDSLYNNDSPGFITQRLTHELGHLVAHRDGEKSGGFDMPTAYVELTSQDAHEWFAEDYSLYLLSDGKRVMKFTIDNTEVPNYDARLQYFQTHYPLANKTK